MSDEAFEGRHGEIPVRRYNPSQAHVATVVWAHGGAFSHGDLEMPESHAVAAALAKRGIEVVAVDYRRVPRWSWFREPRRPAPGTVTYPVPLDDIVDAFARVRAERAAVFLGGASAGACLAAGAGLRLTRERLTVPDGLLLAYGTFHAALPPIGNELRSRIRGRHGILQFRPDTVRRMNLNYAGGAEQLREPFAFPGGHELTGLPPSLLLDADRDSLRASGGAFADELRNDGVAVEHRVLADVTHGFLNRPGSRGFAAAVSMMEAWIRSVV
ncbi:MAG: alpha/beta hydrolase [Humibacter sp.]